MAKIIRTNIPNIYEPREPIFSSFILQYPKAAKPGVKCQTTPTFFLENS